MSWPGKCSPLARWRRQSRSATPPVCSCATKYRTAPGSLTARVDSGGFYGTTGVGPDLYVAAQEAVRAMIAYLVETRDLSPEDAYVLARLAVDLKISESVDAGQYIVSAVLPESIFMA